MKIIVTGSSGFIGSALTIKLLSAGHTVLGLDNHNDYYDISLKEARLSRNMAFDKFTHSLLDISSSEKIMNLFSAFNPSCVVNLAAQAGVRYSIENPTAYISSNIVGFVNVLEACRVNKVAHLVYASSSSVYGALTSPIFSEKQSVDHPLSLYAATKKSNELMAHSYSNLYGLPTTGVRFFTVYGPWGRPDMALFKFTKAIINDEKIQVFNNGLHNRDFTYIDDIVDGLMSIISSPSQKNDNWSGLKPDPASSNCPWRIYNLGRNSPIKLLDFIRVIERAVGKKANIEYLGLQDGDVPNTLADISLAKSQLGFNPKVTVEEGVRNFIDWYLSYYENKVNLR